LRAKDDTLDLVFTGGGAFSRAERAQHQELRIADRISQVSLKDTAMSGAYGNALMCVFPSRFEGFGLPALEAMACGTPAVLARSTSLPEVGGTAAAYFEPGRSDQLAETMTDILGDQTLRSRMGLAGLERAGQFIWSKTAERTAGVYQSLLR
jgi:glycosyltransferase involved in cell wall biosynthesis